MDRLHVTPRRLSMALVVAGLLLVSVGLALWWLPGGFVACGVGVAAIGLLLVNVEGGQRGR